MKKFAIAVMLTASIPAFAGSQVAEEKKLLTEKDCHRHAVAYSLAVGKVFPSASFTEVNPPPVLTTLVLKSPMDDGGSLLLICYDDNTFKAIVHER